MTRSIRPWLTWTCFGVIVVSTTVGLLSPAFTSAVDRSPGFFDGQWWRLISSVLINPESWAQRIFNGVALLVAGAVAERLFGRAGWLLLFLSGGSSAAAYCFATANYGGGTSVAIAGLFGGVVAWILLGIARLPLPPRIAAAAVPVGAVVLVVLHDEHGVPLLVGTALGVLLLVSARRRDRAVPTAAELGSRR